MWRRWSDLLPVLIVFYLIELGGPVIADRLGGFPPWNAHHIAERYGLFVIITLGEVILGTITAVAAAVGRVGAVLTVVVPVLVSVVAYFAIYAYLVHAFDPFHMLLLAGAVVALSAAVLLAFAGASLGVCLLVVMLAPAIIVVGYETVGHRHMSAVVARVLA